MADTDTATSGPPVAPDFSKLLQTYETSSKEGVDALRSSEKAAEGAAGAAAANIDKTMAVAGKEYADYREKTGHTLAEMKPWDADKEFSKRETDPVAAFGSLGSVFGILASAFTHQPLVNSLNASAAAINAIKEGNKEDYERAHKAWEENTKLAMERHNIEHEQWQSVFELLKTNMSAATEKARILASRFGDQKAMFMLENGNLKDLIEMKEKSAELAPKLQEQIDKMTKDHADISSLFAERTDPETGRKVSYNPKNWDSTDPQKVEDNQRALQLWNEDRARIKALEHPSIFGSAKSAIASRAAELMKPKEQGGEGLSEADALMQASVEYKKKTAVAKPAVVTAERMRAGDVQAMVEDYKKQNPKATPQEVAEFRADETRKLKLREAAPTGNRLDELVGKEGQVDQALDLSNKIEGLLAKHNAITGLGGKVTRPAEIVANIFGSNETDRKQFERWVHELQMITPQILTGHGGKPLSAMYEDVMDVVAGLKVGDTTANTVRGYRELDEVMKSIKGRLKERRGETAPAGGKQQPSQQGNWWEKYPAVH